MSEKPKRGDRRKSSILYAARAGIGWALGVLIIGFCLFVSFTLYRFSQLDLSNFSGGVSVVSQGDDAREDSLGYTGFVIPENATDIYFEYYAWQDYSANLRFNLPASEVDLWLETSGLCFELPLTDSNFSPMTNNSSISWWQPADAEIYVTGQQCGNNPYYDILIDQTDSSIWIIYIETLSMGLKIKAVLGKS